jgi:hypothetical protein
MPESENVKNVLDFKQYLNAYEFETELPGSGETVKFRPVTTGQLKRMLVYEGSEDPSVIEGALDELISSSIVTPGFNINNLYLQDRFYLLVKIRSKTKGEMYKFAYKCRECESQTPQAVNLDMLPVKKLEEVSDDIVKLTDSLSVRLSHVTRGDQNKAYEIIGKMKNLSENQRFTEMALFTHAIAIKSIIVPEGEITDSSIKDRKYLLENIPTDSYGKIREWFDNNDFGLDFTYKVKCSSCNNEEEVSIPMENFFF